MATPTQTHPEEREVLVDGILVRRSRLIARAMIQFDALGAVEGIGFGCPFSTITHLDGRWWDA